MMMTTSIGKNIIIILAMTNMAVGAAIPIVRHPEVVITTMITATSAITRVTIIIITVTGAITTVTARDLISAGLR